MYVDLLRQIGNEARALAVAGDTSVIGDGRIGGGVDRNDRGADQSTKAMANEDATAVNTRRTCIIPHVTELSRLFVPDRPRPSSAPRNAPK